MRPIIVIAILSIALGVLAVVVWVWKDSRPQPVTVQVEFPPSGANTASAVPATKPASTDLIAPAVITNAGTSTLSASENAHEKLVSDRSAELMALALQNDPQAHRQIVDELQNPDKTIRQAALDALKQADDRLVIPQMQQIADQTDDPEKKQAILDAIEFINLPSLTEYLHQHQR